MEAEQEETLIRSISTASMAQLEALQVAMRKRAREKQEKELAEQLAKTEEELAKASLGPKAGKAGAKGSADEMASGMDVDAGDKHKKDKEKKKGKKGKKRGHSEEGGDTEEAPSSDEGDAAVLRRQVDLHARLIHEVSEQALGACVLVTPVGMVKPKDFHQAYLAMMDNTELKDKICKYIQAGPHRGVISCRSERDRDSTLTLLKATISTRHLPLKLSAYSGPSKAYLQKPAQVLFSALFEYGKACGFIENTPTAPKLKTFWAKSWARPTTQLLLEHQGSMQ
eukprot:8551068-Prorocentrum_lima.AAC.1